MVQEKFVLIFLANAHRRSFGRSARSRFRVGSSTIRILEVLLEEKTGSGRLPIELVGR